MDFPGRLRRGRAAGDRPGARLHRPGREEGDVIEQPVAGADHPGETGLFDSELLHEHGGFFLLKLAELLLELRADRNDLHAVLRGEFDQGFGLFRGAEVAEILFVGVGADESRHHRQEPVALHPFNQFRIVFVVFRNPAVAELPGQRLDELVFEPGVGIVRPRELVRLVAPFLKRLEVGEHELGQDHVEIVHRVDPAVDMHDVAVLEEPHDMGDRVDAADMSEKLVAEPLALARPFDQSGDVDEFQRGGDDAPRFFEIRKDLEPFIRHRHDAGIRLDRAEREVGRFGAPLAQCIEQSGLSDIRQPDESAGKAHNSQSVVDEGSAPSLP